MTSDYITNKRAGIEHEVLVLEERRGRNEHESDEARLEELGRELEELEIEEALIPFRDAASDYSAACNKHRLWSTEITYQEQRQAKDKLLGMIADVLRERSTTPPPPSQPEPAMQVGESEKLEELVAAYRMMLIGANDLLKVLSARGTWDDRRRAAIKAIDEFLGEGAPI